SPSAAAPSAPTLSARNRRRDRERGMGRKLTSASPPIPLPTFVERGDDFSISFPLSAMRRGGQGVMFVERGENWCGNEGEGVYAIETGTRITAATATLAGLSGWDEKTKRAWKV